MEFTFEVYGKVRGQGRPRSDFKRKRVYKARADREWEESVKEAYINGNGPWFGDRPVSLCVTTHRELPKATPKRMPGGRCPRAEDASNQAHGAHRGDDCGGGRMRVVAATVYTLGALAAAISTGEVMASMVAWMASMLLIASC